MAHFKKSWIMLKLQKLYNTLIKVGRLIPSVSILAPPPAVVGGT